MKPRNSALTGSNVARLITSVERDKTSALQDYIQESRALPVSFGSNFDAMTWQISEVGRESSRAATSVHFTTLSEGWKTKSQELIREPFCSFLKALMRFEEHIKPKGVGTHTTFVRAGRYLHAQLARCDYDPTRLTVSDFDAAQRNLQKREKPSTAYQVGAYLQRIAKELRRKNLLVVPFEWKQPKGRPWEASGRKAKTIRENPQDYTGDKMLTDAHISGIARASQLVETPADVLRQRAVEILICGGFRINELLTIPADCVVEQPARHKDGSPLLDRFGKQKIDLGLRYWPEKGGHTKTMIKWMPTALVDVVRRAIADIGAITEQARSNARYMHENPGKAPLPASLQLLPEDQNILLTALERELGLGKQALSSGSIEFSMVDKPRTGTPQNQAKHARKSTAPRAQVKATTIGKLHDYIRAKSNLNPLMTKPVRQEMRDSLFLAEVHFFASQKAVVPGTVIPVSDNQIYSWLVSKKGDRGQQESVFEKFDIRDETGTIIQFSTHKPRHYLNTVLAEGGLPEHLLARHFGRKDISQNEAYDHRTPVQRGRSLRKKFEEGEAEGPLARILAKMEPADRATYRQTVLESAHVTDYGYCILDWSSLPCQEHGRCVGCAQLVVEKGNELNRNKVQRDSDDNAWLLERAIEEDEDGTLGANNHLEHLGRTLAFSKAILSIHDNSEIPDGTLVQVTMQDGRPITEVVNG
ncbi:MAG: hypothetical protein NXI19_04740 [Alphaproteobacteria bacterium]|nr:hypothetical protein [Alphaproteobacteria bacterium]